MSFDHDWHRRNDERIKEINDASKRTERMVEIALEELRGLRRGEEHIMSQQDDLNALATQEEQDIASIQASQASYAASAAAMKQQIDALVQQQQQNPTTPLDLSGAQQAANDLHTAAQALASAATTEASDASGGGTTPTDPSSGGGTTPIDPTDTGGGTTTPTDPTDTGGGTTTDPTGGGSALPAGFPDQPVYVFTGDGTPADPSWVVVPFTTSDGRQLYTFASDSPGSAANGNGAGGVWQVYDPSQGVQAAPAVDPNAGGGTTTDPSAGGDTGAPTDEPNPPTQ